MVSHAAPDNYYPAEALELLHEAPGSALVGFTREGMLKHSNIPTERIAAFALATADAEGNLAELVEKPDEAAVKRLGDGAVISMNCWLCTPAIFAATRVIPRSALVVAVALALIDHNGFRERPERRENIASGTDLAGYLACFENGLGFGSLTGVRGDRHLRWLRGPHRHAALPRRPVDAIPVLPDPGGESVTLPGDLSSVIRVSGVLADKTGAARSTASDPLLPVTGSLALRMVCWPCSCSLASQRRQT